MVDRWLQRVFGHTKILYRGADKSLARPGSKQATATEDLSFIYPMYSHNWRNISNIYTYNKMAAESIRTHEDTIQGR